MLPLWTKDMFALIGLITVVILLLLLVAELADRMVKRSDRRQKRWEKLEHDMAMLNGRLTDATANWEDANQKLWDANGAVLRTMDMHSKDCGERGRKLAIRIEQHIRKHHETTSP